MSEAEKVKTWIANKQLIHPLSSLSIVDLSKSLVRTANLKDTRVLFILLDGLGSDLLQRALPPDSFLRKHWKRDILTVFPATTTAALSSLFTATHPCEHGLVGWQQRVWHLQSAGGQGEFTDAFPLPWMRAKDGVCLDTLSGRLPDPDSILGLKSSWEQLDVPFAGFSEYADSHFTKATYGKKAKRVRTSSSADLIEALEGVKAWWRQHEASATYVYCKNPDSLEHQHGVRATEVVTKLKKLNAQIEAFVHETSNFVNRMVVVSADHGQIDGEFIHVADQLNDLCDISCEQRTPVFFPKSGVADQTLFARLKEVFDDTKWAILTPDQAEELRLFGPGRLSAKARAQLGSFVGVTCSKQAVHDSAGGVLELVGVHAGFLPEEMHVPLVVFGDKRHELPLSGDGSDANEYFS